MSNTVEQIKTRLSIVDVVGGYLKLVKAGSNYKAVCPFHNEKTPSFMVSPARNSFYCFGCGAKGDIFSFVEQFEGLDFKGSLKILADKAGVPIIYEKKHLSDKNADKKDKAYIALESAVTFYEDCLAQRRDALVYLKDRGIKPKTIESFRLGFARDEWRSLHAHLISEGFKIEDLEYAGLIRKSESGFYDRFRGRIMFPLSDSSGRVVGFTGRVFGNDKDGKTGYSDAKYLNSVDSDIFNKSAILYGLDKARNEIRKFDFTIIVEGQIDLILSHQAGFKNTVAPSGTALTEQQLTLIQRLSNNVILAYDADTAGRGAVAKSAMLAHSNGLDVKVIDLPIGQDPADIIFKDAKEWKIFVKNAKHVVKFFLDVLKSEITDKRKFRKEVIRQVVPLISAMKNTIEADAQIALVTEQIEGDENSVRDVVKRFMDNQETTQSTEDKIQRLTEDVGNDLTKEIYSILIWKKDMTENEVDFKPLIKRSQDVTGLSIDEIETQNFNIFNLEKRYENYEDSMLYSIVSDMLTKLELQEIMKRIYSKQLELKSAEMNKDEELSISILMAIKELTTKKEALKDFYKKSSHAI